MRRRGEQTEDEWEQLQRADKNEMQILTFHTVAVLSLLPLRCPSSSSDEPGAGESTNVRTSIKSNLQSSDGSR